MDTGVSGKCGLHPHVGDGTGPNHELYPRGMASSTLIL